MKSPYFWKNLVLVLLVIANFAFIVWQIGWKPHASTPGSIWWPIVLRALSVVYATGSCLLMIFTVMQFADAEFSKQAQKKWKRQQDWKRIHAGMTKKTGDRDPGASRSQ